MEALFSLEKMDPHAQNVMMATRTKGQSVGTRSKHKEDDDEPVSVKKEENTQQKTLSAASLARAKESRDTMQRSEQEV